MSKTVKTVNPEESKKRGRKPKKQITPEEFKQMVENSKKELLEIVTELELESEKVKPLGLKRIPELVANAIMTMKEDLEEIEENLKEIPK
jgi:hypothetical protein